MAKEVNKDVRVVERGHAPDDLPDEYVDQHATGAGSWWSDPEATSSDPVALANAEAAKEEEGETEDDLNVSDSLFHPADHTVDETVTHVTKNPDDLTRVLQEEKASPDPRTTLVSKLEAMNAE